MPKHTTKEDDDARIEHRRERWQQARAQSQRPVAYEIHQSGEVLTALNLILKKRAA